jgi:hypothetical protein
MNEENIKKDSKIIIFLSTLIGALIIAALITGILSLTGTETSQSKNIIHKTTENSNSPIGNFFTIFNKQPKTTIEFTAQIRTKEIQKIELNFNNKEQLKEIELNYKNKNNEIIIGPIKYSSEINNMKIYNYTGDIILTNTLSLKGSTEYIERNSDTLTFEKSTNIKTTELKTNKIKLKGIINKKILFEKIEADINIETGTSTIKESMNEGSLLISNFNGDIEYTDNTYTIKGTGQIQTSSITTNN